MTYQQPNQYPYQQPVNPPTLTTEQFSKYRKNMIIAVSMAFGFGGLLILISLVLIGIAIPTNQNVPPASTSEYFVGEAIESNPEETTFVSLGLDSGEEITVTVDNGDNNYQVKDREAFWLLEDGSVMLSDDRASLQTLVGLGFGLSPILIFFSLLFIATGCILRYKWKKLLRTQQG